MIARRILLLAAASALLFSAPPASAATITDRPLLFSFDGSDATAGRFTAPSDGSPESYLQGLAVDSSTGAVYVTSGIEAGFVSKFDPAGAAATFSGTGTSSLFGPPGHTFESRMPVAVDNSGGPGQGRLYIADRFKALLDAFTQAGGFLWEASAVAGDVAVDPSGDIWVIAGSTATKYAASGPPLTPLGSVSGLSGGGNHAMDVDASGNVYVINPGLRKYVKVGPSTWEPGPVIDPTAFPDVYIDQSSPTGHVFALHGSAGYFNEYDSTGALIGEFGTGGAISQGGAIAYNPSLDRVYVADNGSYEVRAFGPPITGTAPDPAIEASDGIGVGKATFHGTVNPQGVANAYYFEWATSCCGEWRDTSRSPLQSLPEDSSSHPVSYTSLALRGNTNHKVRLVAINTANGLRSTSGTTEFKTLQQTQAPPVTIDPVAEAPTAPCTIGIGTEAACVSGTINPLEETLSWWVQLSTDPACESGFATKATQTLSGEGATTPVPVHFDLDDLAPAQHYCARIVATNSFGSTTSETKEFTTDPIPPGEASAAFAAPRTDTTARINARLNPNGEADFEYRFEWKEEGAAEWTALPIRTSQLHTREPVIVAEELSGLKPAIAYRYRLVLARNAAGDAASLGEERTFTTRSEAEIEATDPPSCPNEDVRAAQDTTYLGSCRGIELVNNPDKGNQHAFARGPGINSYTSPLAARGERLLWSVEGGAPGAPNGAENSFLAQRTATGWSSESAAPPGEGQAGGGDFVYLPSTASSNLDAFLFIARLSTAISGPTPLTFVRVREGAQDILMRTATAPTNPGQESSVDISEDGEHVFALNADEGQLEDIGAARVGPPAVPGEVVSVMPDGQPSECGLDINNSLSFAGILGSNLTRRGDHWVATSDGSRVYFRAKPNADEAGGGSCASASWHLYVRNREAGKTILIDPGDPEFLGTTPDGNVAYLATSSSLDPADNDLSSPDLYRWDEEAGEEGEASCLTCMVKAGATEGAAHLAKRPGSGGLASVVISNDFSRIYFQSAAKLFPDRGKQGTLNLYVLTGEEIHFVATTEADVLVDTSPSPSADGTQLMFEASASPALSADPMPAQCIQPSGTSGECEQLYLYDDRDQSIECLSCRRDGATTHSYGSLTEGPYQEGRLSADGSTAAFATPEALLPLDINGDIDIYEWRGGVLHLISDGEHPAQKGFAAPRVWAVSPDGSDIFFGLLPPEGSLTGFEVDSFLNVYDARAGGGFMPPAPREDCEGDGCQGPLAAPPPLKQPVTTGTSRGNVVESRPGCRKGKVRRRGRCVPRRALTRRACARKDGAAKRRCIAKQHRRAARANRRADR